MSFTNPEILFLIWAVPVLFLVYYLGMRKRRKIISSFSSKKSIEIIIPDASVQKRWFKALLMIFGILFFIISLTGPRYGYKWIDVEKKGIDIFIALDCSRSMLAEDVRPSRLERAKYEIIDLLNMLKGDRVGLVAFSGTAFLQCPLTHDYETFYLFLDSLTPDFMPVGGTNLSQAIAAGISGFDPDSNSDKAIILITDGESTADDPIKSAKAAGDQGIKIFCIGIGGKEGVPVLKKEGGFSKDNSGNIVLTKLDDGTLKEISSLTGGIYVKSVAGDMDLENIYSNKIRGNMESATISSGRKKIWEDRYQWFLGIALLFLMIEMILSSVKKNKIIPILMCVFTLSLGGFTNDAYADDAHDLIDKGISAYDNKDYAAALKSFIDGQLLSPDDDMINFNIGTAYYKSCDYQSALNHFDKGTISDNNELKQKSYYNKGNTEFRLQQFEPAIESYEKYLKMNPEDQKAAANLKLARKMLEKQKQEQQSSENNKPQDKKDDTDEGESKNRSGDIADDSKDKQNKPDENNKRQDRSESDKSDNSDSKASEPDSSDSNKNTQYGDSMNDSQQNQENRGAEESSKPPTADSSTEQMPTSPSSEERQAGDRALDRLEDRPGAALVPRYMDKSIDKDW